MNLRLRRTARLASTSRVPDVPNKSSGERVLAARRLSAVGGFRPDRARLALWMTSCDPPAVHVNVIEARTLPRQRSRRRARDVHVATLGHRVLTKSPGGSERFCGGRRQSRGMHYHLRIRPAIVLVKLESLRLVCWRPPPFTTPTLLVLKHHHKMHMY